MKKLFLLAISFLLTISICSAATFKAGTDYTVLTAAQIAKVNPAPTAKGKVKVIEFFNYGCPACAYAEPAIEQWLKTKPRYVEFTRLPVAFEQGWDTYAKAYYVAKALGIEDKITPNLFYAIHGKDDRQYHDLSSTKAIINFFVQQGVKPDVAKNAFTGSSAATLELQIKQNLTTMANYGVYGTPTFVVGDKYTVSLSQAKSTKRFMQIVDYLARKSRG